MINASNLEFSRWGAVFSDDQMVAAVIDGRVRHGRLIRFHGESHRVRGTHMREERVLRKGDHIR
ncbi:ATP-binding protein [Coriobacterium glomerans]|uniref:ATP-binding protein n=1 Tax=Coriobacterium glomerans TaxID=33871 RepID=UPI0002F44A2F|nr:ATP-binding protein [Coriobacterium glomerans]